MRELTPSQLLHWAEHDVGVMRLRTDRDVLPNGFMAATLPMLIDWRRSALEAKDRPVVMIRHVSYGGSPLERTTVLHSLRVPLYGVRAAEFTLVPSSVRAVRAAVHHAQLRFIFDRDHRPELIHLAGEETGTDPYLDDLVLSWESWRPMSARFDLKTGLDEAAYGLALRAFAGPQRFLEDQLQGLDWFCHRLEMPGGHAGLVEHRDGEPLMIRYGREHVRPYGPEGAAT